MASPSYTYTLTNGTTADATQVTQNFTDILNGITDGTKDLSISALTCAGTATLNGHVNLGNAAADDLTITASLASSLPVKTTASFDVGSSTLGLRSVYLGANSQTVRLLASSSMSATWTLTTPVNAGTAGYHLITDGAGVTSWTLATQGTATNDDAAAGKVGEYQQQSRLEGSATSLTSTTPVNLTSTALSLTAGDWEVTGAVAFTTSGASFQDFELAFSKTSATLPATTTRAVPTSGEFYITYSAVAVAGDDVSVHSTPTVRISLSSTTTIYFVVQATYSGGTVTAYGSYWARRAR